MFDDDAGLGGGEELLVTVVVRQQVLDTTHVCGHRRGADAHLGSKFGFEQRFHIMKKTLKTLLK